jgi:hypothetical protein
MQESKKIKAGQPIICQLLSLIPEQIFKNAVEKTNANYYYKKMLAKDHFVCLFYAVITRNASLREVCKQIVLLGNSLVYCGLKQIPKKSTLSDANKWRDEKFFQQLYLNLYGHYKSYLKASTFSLPIGGEVDAGRVEIFDSSTITLFKEILKGAGRNAIDGKKKGGLKVFTKINYLENVPNYICMKAASANETGFLALMKLEEGSIALMDKGFNKYAYFAELTATKRYFVTRLKDNAKYEVDTQNPIDAGSDIVSDEAISLIYKEKKIKRTVKLRLVIFKDPISGEILKFLTNLENVKAQTIAQLYKNRWVIEVFFKQLKQNFELKYFLADSENGIKSQIWVALIANLIFTVIERMTKKAEDFSTLVSIAAKNLCSYIAYIQFISEPEIYTRLWMKSEMLPGIVQQINFDRPGGG